MRLPYLTTATRLERPQPDLTLTGEAAAKLDALVLACLSEHYRSGATAADIGMTLSRPRVQVMHSLARLQYAGRVAVVSGEGDTAVHCIPGDSRRTAERVIRERDEQILERLNVKRRRVT